MFTARERETDRQRVKEYLQQDGDSEGGGGEGDRQTDRE